MIDADKTDKMLHQETNGTEFRRSTMSIRKKKIHPWQTHLLKGNRIPADLVDTQKIDRLHLCQGLCINILTTVLVISAS